MSVMYVIALLAGCTRFGFGLASGDASDGPDLSQFVNDSRTDVTADQADLAVEQQDQNIADASVVDTNPSSQWVTVGANTFLMGSPSNEPCREYGINRKETQHSVTLTRSFEIAVTEVTQKQYENLMGYNPSVNNNCPDCPVENLTWHEAAAYCNALSDPGDECYDCVNPGKPDADCTMPSNIYDCTGYRLPTEAEWELAYRAGTTEASYAGAITDCFGADETAKLIGWFDKNSSNKTQPVGQKPPNPLGLYDMAGNVWEWCQDQHVDDLGSTSQTDPVGTSGYAHTARGGASSEHAGTLRAATRAFWPPLPGAAERLYSTGFRCARTLTSNK